MAAKKDQKCSLLDGEGETYGGWLTERLYDPNLSEAIIASPYLTLGAAGQLVLSLCQRPKRNPRPIVTLIIGALDRFTRKQALQHLLKYATGGQRATESKVQLEVVRPPDHLHLKAAWVRLGARRRVAAVGSHNLTETGLACEGELGVVLHRSPEVDLVAKALDEWRSQSNPWSGTITTYKHSKQIPGGSGGPGRGAPDEPVSRTAPKVDADEDLTDPEETERKAAIRTFEARNPKAAYGGDFWNTDVDFVSARRESPQGAHFDLSYEKESWKDGKQRKVVRVFRVLPTFKGKESIVLYKTVLSYRVTPCLREAAETLGITDDETAPDPLKMQQYIDLIRAKRRAARKGKPSSNRRRRV